MAIQCSTGRLWDNDGMPFELFVGLRYTLTRRHDNFVSTISVISMAGLALSVASLIVVLSVVNGFEREFRERILSATAHVQITAPGGPLEQWQALASSVRLQPRVESVEPYVDAQAMLSSGSVARGVLLHGIEPQADALGGHLAAHLRAGRLDALQPGQWHVILGADLAAALGVGLGERIALVSPQSSAPGRMAPRLHDLEVVGIIALGLYQFDSVVALMNMQDVAALGGEEAVSVGATGQAPVAEASTVSGLRLRLHDPFAAPEVAQDLARQWPGLVVSPWTRTQGNLFQAVRTSKAMLAIILALIVGVAAFNIVATLVMAVVDKEADIAILRTLGASRGAVLRIFMLQGVMIGLIGTLTGLVLGVAVAVNVDVIVPAIERLTGFRFLSAEVYQIGELPSAIHLRDLVMTVAASLGLSFLATLYPSWRASQVAPAQALRDE